MTFKGHHSIQYDMILRDELLQDFIIWSEHSATKHTTLSLHWLITTFVYFINWNTQQCKLWRTCRVGVALNASSMHFWGSLFVTWINCLFANMSCYFRIQSPCPPNKSQRKGKRFFKGTTYIRSSTIHLTNAMKRK